MANWRSSARDDALISDAVSSFNGMLLCSAARRRADDNPISSGTTLMLPARI